MTNALTQICGAFLLQTIESGSLSNAALARPDHGALSRVWAAVCTENPIRVDEKESPKLRNDRATTFRSGDFGLAIQVEEPA
jgi:hypothetical protein